MKTLIVRFQNDAEYDGLKKDAHKHEKTLSDYIRWLICKEKSDTRKDEIKIICENEKQYELINYIIMIGSLNCKKEYIEDVIGLKGWDGKINVNYQINDKK